MNLTLIHPLAALSFPFMAALRASFSLARTSSAATDEAAGAGVEALRSVCAVMNVLDDGRGRIDGLRNARESENMLVGEWTDGMI